MLNPPLVRCGLRGSWNGGHLHNLTAQLDTRRNLLRVDPTLSVPQAASLLRARLVSIIQTLSSSTFTQTARMGEGNDRHAPTHDVYIVSVSLQC